MINGHKLKIGLDYHGVIDKNIDYFGLLCRIAKQRGHHIFIITGGPKTLVEQNLKLNNISYDMCFAISDYYIAMGKVMEKDGKLSIPENLWNIAKADFCRRSNINIHIDDSKKYLKWFSTPYCYYNKKTNKGYISPEIEFDFNNPVEKVLDKIEQTILNLTYFL